MNSLKERLLESINRNRSRELISGSLRYGDLLSDEIDSVLQSQPKGSVVCINCESPELFLKWLVGCIKADLKAAPLSPDLTSKESKSALSRLSPRVLVTDNDISVIDLVSSEDTESGFLRFTSGTTGEAKGVFVSSEAALYRIDSCKSAFNLQPGETVMWGVSLHYHFVSALLLFIESGLSLDFTGRSKNASIIYGSPWFYEMLSAPELPALRLPLSTTVALSRRTFDRFYKSYGVPIRQVYGVFEVGLALANLDKPLEMPDSIGAPLPGYQVKILNEGLLAVKGPGMFTRYFYPKLETKDILRDGWFITGDIATKTDNSFSIVGRSNSVLNVAGLKVFPEEVEEILCEHPGVKHALVTGDPHEIFGTVIKASIVKAGDVSAEELKRFCRGALSPYKVPKEFYFVEDIPHTNSGKIKRV